MKVFALLILLSTLAVAQTPKTRHHTPTDLEKATTTLAPLLSDANMKVVNDCHELVLDATEGDGEISHSTSFSCYRTIHPLYKALVAAYVKVDADNPKWEHLAKLLDRVRSDDSFFWARLDPDERDSQTQKD